MADRELVSRYFAFRLLYDFYDSTETMDDFIDKGMNALDSLYGDIFEKEIVRFRTTMLRCHELLEDIAFLNLNSRQKRINNNLFDVFSCVISDLSDSEYQKLLNNVQLFKERYRMLFSGEGFLCKDKLRQGTKKAVRERFKDMKNFINQFI